MSCKYLKDILRIELCQAAELSELEVEMMDGEDANLYTVSSLLVTRTRGEHHSDHRQPAEPGL